MNEDTKNFLITLLWMADNPDEEKRPFIDKSIYDFTPEFVAAADAFVAGFRAHLVKIGFDMAALDHSERTFGGNCYFSLSGHGCGFFDDRNEVIAGLQDIIKEWAGGFRFEELAECYLEVNDDGKIDLSFIPEAIEEYRNKFFKVEEKA